MMSKSAHALDLCETSWAWDATLEDRMTNLLLGPGTMHDFTFRLGPNCDKDWIPVHKIVVASGSPVFYRIIKDAGNADHVDASQLPYSVGVQEFRRLIEFLYSGRPNFKKVSNPTDLMRLHEAAQKYEMRSLQHLCKGGMDMLLCFDQNISPSTSAAELEVNTNFANVASGSSALISPMITQINAEASPEVIPSDIMATRMLPLIREEVAKMKIELKTELMERMKVEFLSLAGDVTQQFDLLTGKMKAEVSQEIRDLEIVIRSPQAVEEPLASVSASTIYGPIGSGHRQARPDTSDDAYSWTSSEDIGAPRSRQTQQQRSTVARPPGYPNTQQQPQQQFPSRAASTPYPNILTDPQNRQQGHSSNNDILGFDFNALGGRQYQPFQLPYVNPFLPLADLGIDSTIQANDRLQELQQLPIWGLFNSQQNGSLL